jgi:glyoxylase-like metal-dependent hydrolase (beta-lactamase superfamily II)
VEELTDLPVSVVNTHTHYDHIGSNTQWEEVAVYDHPDEIARLRAGIDNARLQRYITDEYLWKPLPEGFDGSTWTFPPHEPTSLLHDGDVIDLGGRSLEVIFTPGHAAGHACLLDAANRILFTGDHFYPGPLYAHEADVDIDLYVASNQKIAARIDEYDHVCAGHNDPWVDAEVIPRVSAAFDTILSGGGEFTEADGLRRYRFDGFDVLIRTEQVMEGAES